MSYELAGLQDFKGVSRFFSPISVGTWFFFFLGTGILSTPPLHQSNAFHPVESLHR